MEKSGSNPEDLERKIPGSEDLEKENKNLAQQNEELVRKLEHNKWKSRFWLSFYLNLFALAVVIMVMSTTTWKSPEYVEDLEKERNQLMPLILSLKNDSCLEKRLAGLPLDHLDECQDSLAVTEPVSKSSTIQDVPAEAPHLEFFGPQADENLRLAKAKQKEEEERIKAEAEQALADAEAEAEGEEEEEESESEPEAEAATSPPSIPSP